MRQKPNALKIVPLYRKHLQTKSTTSNNYGNVFLFVFWKQHEASEICPTHNFTKIQDRPTPGLILPLGPRPIEACVVTTPIFLPKPAQKSKSENKHCSLDFSLSIDRQKSLALKWLSFGQETYAQIWACTPYLGHNINIFEWNQPYLISTSKLHIVCVL